MDKGDAPHIGLHHNRYHNRYDLDCMRQYKTIQIFVSMQTIPFSHGLC